MHKGRISVRAVLLAGCLGSTVLAAPAWAQAAAEQEEADPVATPVPGEAPNASGGQTGNSIIVTGSRIARRDYVATSPIVTVDADLIEESSQINLEANLNKLPQFTPALTQFNTGDFQANANNTIGISTVSLRQLGSNRNLVLIDGRRGMPVSGTGVVDINSIPSAAVQRVEVITGGASSTYGADAVGGVVNFILKDNYEGASVDVRFGDTQHGGDQTINL
ncbi:MAG TPA: TonB-dependent receptor plug domain-containing protein, partial [Croceibacterium sp.]